MTTDEMFQKLSALRLHAAHVLHEQLENPAAYTELDVVERAWVQLWNLEAEEWLALGHIQNAHLIPGVAVTAPGATPPITSDFHSETYLAPARAAHRAGASAAAAHM
jgi:hypothetical protein